MKIKGGVLAARTAFVKEHFGDEGWQRVLGALSPDDHRAMQGLVLVSGWYPFALGTRLDDAIVRVLGRGDMGVFEQMGAASARKNLGGAHKDFLVSGDPHAFLEKAPTIYGFYYDVGRREYVRTGPASGVLTTYDAETFSAAECLTNIGWHKEALAMCGAQDVRIEEPTCRATGGDVCRYEVAWRPLITT
jgi:uncharacterized protein (TIGR02265 family)